MTRRSLLPLALFPLAAGLTGFHPAPEGTETIVGVGFSRTEHDTDSSPVYRYRHSGMSTQLMARHRFPSRLTLAGQLAVDTTLVSGFQQRTRTELDEFTSPSSKVGQVQAFGAAVGRVGLHLKFAGAEAGFAAVRMPSTGGAVLPSGLAWVGAPKLMYAFAQTAAGPIAGSAVLAEPTVGVGHRGDQLSAWVGYHVWSRLEEIPPREDAPWTAGGAIEISPGVRVGVDYGRGTVKSEQGQPDERVLMLIQVDHARKDVYW